MNSFYRPHDRLATSWKNELVDDATGEVTYPPSMTKQSFADQCDINKILKQYKMTGQIRHISAKAAIGSYEDLPEPQDFQEAMNLVIASEKSFATLPSHVRARFGNDPAQFLGFMADPSNQDEIIKLGLARDSRPQPQAQAQAPASEGSPKAPSPEPTNPPPKA